MAQVDATLNPRERFEGRIAFAGDVDRIAVPAIAATDLTFIVTAKSGSQVHPRIRVLRNGIVLEPEQFLVLQGGREERAIRFPILEDGPLDVEVSAPDGSIGEYRLKLRERSTNKLDWKVTIAAGASHSLTFPARSGVSAVVKIERLGNGSAPLVPPKLVAPQGDEVALDAPLTFESGGISWLEVGPLVLSEDGSYRLDLAADPSESVKLRARVELDPSVTPVTVVDEPEGASSISGTLFVEGSDWLDTESFDGDFVADEVLVRTASRERAAAVAMELGLDVVDWSSRGFARLSAHVVAKLGVRAATSAADRARVAELCRAARRLPGVGSAEPNHLRREFSLPSDPLFPQQWDFLDSGFAHALDLSQGDATRTIAVLDTGVRFEHPDLAGKFVAGYDFVSDSWNASDGNGLDPDPTDPILTNGTHGTHVSGTLVAATDNALGIAGGTRLGKVMPIRVLGLLGGTDFDIAQAILFAARLPNNSGTLPPQRCEVINMSLGGPSPSAALDDAVKQAIAAGVVVVAAAGNSNSKLKMYPAAIDGVIAVAATDRVDNKAFYSSFGPHVSLAAPGGDPYADADGDGVLDGILSTVVDVGLGPTWSQKSGTSMACPHVAAAAFLLRSIAPNLTPIEVRAFLCAGALDLGAPGPDKYYGYGRLDAGRALDDLLGTGSDAAQVFACPSSMQFDEGVDDQQLAVVGMGNWGASGPVQLLSVHAGAFYVEVAGASTLPCELPLTLSLHVDRAALLPGTYATTIDIVTSLGTKSMPVEVTVPETGVPPLVDRAYAFAYDVIRKEVVQVVTVDHDDGGHFEFDALPEGTYRLFASTDLDLDGQAGESHDFAGDYLVPSTLESKFAAKDGESKAGLVVFLKQGGSKDLPKGGPFAVPAGP